MKAAKTWPELSTIGSRFLLAAAKLGKCWLNVL